MNANTCSIKIKAKSKMNDTKHEKPNTMPDPTKPTSWVTDIHNPRTLWMALVIMLIWLIANAALESVKTYGQIWLAYEK